MHRTEIQGNPDQLTNDDIHAIGNLCSTQNKYPLSGFMKAPVLPIATSLINYNEDTTAQNKWMFLAETYKSLPNNRNILATEIRNLFCLAFKLDDKKLTRFACLTISSILTKTINDHYANKNISSPDKITNEKIQEIGNAYLHRHGKNPSWLSSLFHLHINQPSARKLKHCNVNNSEKRWIFLADVYEALPNSRGEIAKAIVNLFIDAFGERANQLKEVGYFSNTTNVANDLRAIIEAKYRVESKLPDLNLNPSKLFSVNVVDKVIDYGTKFAFNALLK